MFNDYLGREYTIVEKKPNLIKNKMKYIVYQTLNLVNNKIYIGVHKTKDPDVFDGYIGCGIVVTNSSTYTNPKTPLQYAVKKYGTSKFRRSILFVFDTAEEAYNKEADIVTWDFINRSDTYNAKLGGIGGSCIYIKINQFDLDGNLVNTWNSIKEASEFYNISDTAISNAEKFCGSCIGYYWSRESNIDISKYKNLKKTICYKYNSLGKLVDTYNSIYEAAKLNDELVSVIERAIKGGYKVKGFYYDTTIREVYTGKNKVSLRGKTLYVYDLDGNFIIELSNSKDIKDYFKISSTN